MKICADVHMVAALDSCNLRMVDPERVVAVVDLTVAHTEYTDAIHPERTGGTGAQR